MLSYLLVCFFLMCPYGGLVLSRSCVLRVRIIVIEGDNWIFILFLSVVIVFSTCESRIRMISVIYR